MTRPGWFVIGVVTTQAANLGWPRGPAAIRVTAIELVDDRGDVVGHLGTTASGTELVLGGQAQISLVTDGPLAAINLSGADQTRRWMAPEDPPPRMASPAEPLRPARRPCQGEDEAIPAALLREIESG